MVSQENAFDSRQFAESRRLEILCVQRYGINDCFSGYAKRDIDLTFVSRLLEYYSVCCSLYRQLCNSLVYNFLHHKKSRADT